MEKEINELINKLDHTILEEKIKAVKRLAEIGDVKAVKPLIDLLRKSLGDWNKRKLVSACVEALGKLGTSEAQEILLKTLDSNLFYIKAQAAREIAKIDPDDRAIEKLETILHEDAPKEVKKDVVQALGATEEEKAVEPLVDVVKGEFSQDIKEEAVEALGEIKEEEAIAPLMEFYYEEANEKLKIDVLRALSQIAGVSSMEFLIQALSDKNPEIRSCAALALGEVRNKMAEASLNKCLSDPDENVRKSAAKAIGLIKYLPIN